MKGFWAVFSEYMPILVAAVIGFISGLLSDGTKESKKATKELFEKQLEIFAPMVSKINYGRFALSDLEDVIFEKPYLVPEQIVGKFENFQENEDESLDTLESLIINYYEKTILKKLRFTPRRYPLSKTENLLCVIFSFGMVFTGVLCFLYIILLFLSYNFWYVNNSFPTLQLQAISWDQIVGTTLAGGAIAYMMIRSSYEYIQSVRGRKFTTDKRDNLKRTCFDIAIFSFSVLAIIFTITLLSGVFSWFPYSLRFLIIEAYS